MPRGSSDISEMCSAGQKSIVDTERGSERSELGVSSHTGHGDPPDPPILKSTGVADNSQGTQRSLGSDEEI